MREYELSVLLVLCFYFIIGGIAVYFIAKKKTGFERRETWTKYFMYLLIICVLQFVFFRSQWWSMVLLLMIATVGLAELIIVARRSGLLFLLSSIAIYLVLSIYFVSLQSLQPELPLTFFMVVVFDGFSQIIGQLLGGKKLAPVISPNKTLSGFIGGAAMLLITSLCLFGPLSIPVSALLCISALTGDLLASYVKRRGGVKDYSKLIPGHGGFLDRFDSFIMAGAIRFFLLFEFQF